MNRINWIDWGKAIAITMVVFGHIPMEADNFLLRYITIFHMPLFFFISGYLTKTGRPIKTLNSKYMTSLVYPYIIYNVVFYPYWLIRYYFENNNEFGPIYDWTIRPFMGALLLQYDCDFSCNLNGVTWFVAALIIMKVTLEIATRMKYGKHFLIFISILCIIGYTANEYYLFTKNITPIGFMKCFPFYILGYKMKHLSYINDTNVKACHYQTLTGFTLSILFFIISFKLQPPYIINSFLFYAISIYSILFILAVCKLLNEVHSIIIKNISIGTLMIMGLHWMLIGTINFTCSKLFIAVNPILYSTLQGIIICFAIVTLIYFPICWSKKHLPIFIGK